MWVKATPFVQQHALRTLEEHAARPIQVFRDVRGRGGRNLAQQRHNGTQPALGSPVIAEYLVFEPGQALLRRLLGHRGEFCQQIAPDEVQPLHCQGRTCQIAIAQDMIREVQGVPHRLANADTATTMRLGSSLQFAQAAGSLMKRGIDAAPMVDLQALERILDSERPQTGVLDQQRRGMHDHRVGKHRRHARHQCSGGKLRKRMVPAVRQHHVMPRLCSAVEAYHRVRRPAAAQRIRKQALAAIAEAKTQQ